ncbi:hypothetical protein HELRODRAFT_188019 [Helobdella robusta]|uniref:U3 small nucleolar RNA-associated protein 6 N-terminal domain-containing protein n=1 Tax=Helobdella robusta TaxID=6412 RepID=T1FPJ9_HELRO|nr:hypothetical protein HELRODRAFT_188019 [Helobdella robusta]ESO12869.1 hypothetical protein HELRODRAFT_188019 [Helobdella robusta]
MSEFAERMVQKMLPELNKMRDLKLFTTVEVSKILKKRRAHEYKTKRKIKQLKDHLQYIDYEIMVMELIKKRRKMMNCHTNKRDIEVPIIKRIHRLFQTASIKFSGCVEVFLKHIEFCIKMNEKITISVLFTQALKLHARNENLWIMAAKHEMERINSMAGARNLFHRSLRFNPHSKKLYLEYFKMELLNAEKLRKRRELLLGDGADNDATTAAAVADNDATASNNDDDDAAAAASDDDKDAGGGKDEEDSNSNIMNGSVAFVVFQEAVKEFPGDVSLYMEFIDVCHLFDFARWIEDAIYTHLSADTDLSTNDAAQVVVACRKLTEIAHKLDGSGEVILSRESKAAAVESAIEDSWNSFNDSLKELNTIKMGDILR